MQGHKDRRSARYRALTYWFVGAGLSLGYFGLRHFGWQVPIEQRGLVECSASLLAFVVGALALVRSHADKSNGYLIVGLVFVGVGLLDGLHAILGFGWLSGNASADLDSLVAWSWMLSPLLLAVGLGVRWVVWKHEDRIALPDNRVRMRQTAAYSTAVLVILAGTAWFALAPLPLAYRPEFVCHRPEGYLPALFFLLGLLGYLKKGERPLGLRARGDPGQDAVSSDAP